MAGEVGRMTASLNKLRQALRRLLSPGDPPVPESGDRYVVARCIGCGQCAGGCPVRIRVRTKKK